MSPSAAREKDPVLNKAEISGSGKGPPKELVTVAGLGIGVFVYSSKSAPGISRRSRLGRHEREDSSDHTPLPPPRLNTYLIKKR